MPPPLCPSASAMATRYATHWIADALAGDDSIDLSVIQELLRASPDALEGAPEATRERLALRYLQELIAAGEGADAAATAGLFRVDGARSCEDALSRLVREELEKDLLPPFSQDIQETISTKKFALPGTSFQLLKGVDPWILRTSSMPESRSYVPPQEDTTDAVGLGARSPERSSIIEGNMLVRSVLAEDRMACEEQNTDKVPVEVGDAIKANQALHDDGSVRSKEGLSQQDLCIKCGKDGELLTCSECSLAVHGSCFGPSVTYEVINLFYCPVCSCKKAREVYLKKKKKYLDAKKEATAFLGTTEVSKQHDEQLNGVQPGAAKRDGHLNGPDMSKRNNIHQNEAYDEKESAVPSKSRKVTAKEDQQRKTGPVHPQKRYSSPVAPTGRRRRVPWTAAEEAILRDGMEKFKPQDDGQNSWVRILIYGRAVFDEARRPSDLRVKWRNLMKKEASGY